MTTTEPQGMCRAVDENMSDIIDGVADDALFDHMALCERCRDARYDTEHAIVRLGDASADYHFPSDMEARVMRALSSRASLRPSERLKAIGERLSEKPRALLESLARRGSRTPAPARAPGAWRDAGAVGRLLGKRWGWLSLAASIGLALLWLSARREREAPKPIDLPELVGAWQGEVLQVERAFGSPSGLSGCARGASVCQPLKAGDVAHAGMRLETDGLTRALIELADGSALSLDRRTRFELAPNERRRGRLLEGNMIVEVERQSEPRGASAAASHAVIDVPFGRAEVLGTKLSLRATNGSTRVEVSRGNVRVVDTRDQATTLAAGEAAVMTADGAQREENVSDLGQAFAWSSSAFATAPADQTRGALGELIAASDGPQRPGALRLAQHHIRVRIVDNIARTEIEEVFENGSDERLETTYRLPLPPGARIERLALEVDGELVEGAFVARERAAAIGRGAAPTAGGKPAPGDVTWVPGPWRDPTLLDWQRGGRLELRLPPIAARASRRIVLAYGEILPPSEGEHTYTYPLPTDRGGGTRIGRFTADVSVRGHSAARGVRARGYPMQGSSDTPDLLRLAFEADDFSPSGDLSVAFELSSADAELRAWVYQPGIQEGSPAAGTVAPPPRDRGPHDPLLYEEPGVPADAPYIALALRPSLPRRSRDEPRDYVLVADTSRSMIGERHRRAAEVIGAIVREMDRGDRVKLIACDSLCQEWPGGYTRPGDSAAAAAAGFVQSIEPEGASDLAFAIESAATLRERDVDRQAGAPRGLRVIYVGDGTPTVGPIHPALLERAVAEALPLGGTFSAVAIGNLADAATLRVATRAGGGVSVGFTPGRRAEDVAYEVLGASYGRSLQKARLELPEGLVRVTPRKLGSIAAGTEALVVARLTRPRVAGHVILRGEVAGEAFEQRYPLDVTARPGEVNAFVPRLYASVAIAELDGAMDENARQRSIELSTRFNVASRYTSLLVRESPVVFGALGLDDRSGRPDGSGEPDRDDGPSDSALPPESQERIWQPAPGTSGAASSAPGAGGPGEQATEAARAVPEASDDPYAPPGVEAEAQPEKDAAASAPRWIPMRRVWERIGQIEVPPAVLPLAAPARREALEQRLRDDADSRDALRGLYASELLAGDLEAAARSAARWSTKDPLDVDALTARADLAAQRGDRDLAIRILGGVVDVHPADYRAQGRLARLHRWAGRAERGCRHSLAVAQLSSHDAKLVTEAIGCARDAGQHRTADVLLGALASDVRREVERQAQSRHVSEALAGDVRVQASWQGSEHDIDVVILDPEGYRISWLGAPTRSVISASDVLSAQREGLGLRGAAPGKYAVELVRASPGRGVVRGDVRLSVAKAERSLPFVLEGERVRVATLTLRHEARLVPLDAWE